MLYMFENGVRKGDGGHDRFSTQQNLIIRRIAEKEDVIRRKNMLITKLKKDVMVLEQKENIMNFQLMCVFAESDDEIS
ncbi:hypothetical protein M8C21_007831 [Ambrosia artemisiifolia]|uniref:Uncharacterized protein n=1 Tax=Ambrosia artemisiifolia TaxID=4212 RepID=A0AAD5CL27_AMBAR|nr:hypothetical protein M8C21_007831 [Ambrosia artemisiifolia]